MRSGTAGRRCEWVGTTRKEQTFIEDVTRVTCERERACRRDIPLTEIQQSFALEARLTHTATHMGK